MKSQEWTKYGEISTWKLYGNCDQCNGGESGSLHRTEIKTWLEKRGVYNQGQRLYQKWTWDRRVYLIRRKKNQDN